MSTGGIIAAILAVIVAILVFTLIFVYLRGKKGNSMLTSTTSTYDRETTELREQIRELESQKSKLDSNVVEYRSIIKQLNEQIDELQQKFGNSNEENSNKELAKCEAKWQRLLAARIDGLNDYHNALDTIEQLNAQIADLKKRLAEANELPTVNAVIDRIEQAMMNSWDSEITPYLRQNVESVAKMLSTRTLVPTLVKRGWTKERVNKAIGNIENALHDIKDGLNTPIDRLK